MTTEVDSQRIQDELQENVKFVSPASTDEVLVAAAKLGEPPSVLELWTRHSSRVFKATYKIRGNRLKVLEMERSSYRYEPRPERNAEFRGELVKLGRQQQPRYDSELPGGKAGA